MGQMPRAFERFSRRRFCGSFAGPALIGPGLAGAWLSAGVGRARGQAPAAVVAAASRPQIVGGVASGDVTAHGAILWSRADRPAQMHIEWSTTESFTESRQALGPAALEDTAFTAKLDLRGLPAGERIFYRVRFQDLTDLRAFSEPCTGSFRTPPGEARDVKFIWSGDTAGQGFGIDLARGGMTMYETIRRQEPDFFLHSGDYVYADSPLPEEIRLPDGSVWKNLVTPEKSKVAETLDEFRGNYAYNLLDENVRRFNASVPQYIQWDDHETTNNWYPGESLAGDRRYQQVTSCSLLAARGRRALFEFTPLRDDPQRPEQIYRAFRYGPQLELIVLDARTYRGANSANRQERPSPETAFFGPRQLEWLKRRLKGSTATWKIVACDMPLGLIVPDAGGTFENAANGAGPPLGREHELASLLSYLKRENVQNVVWLTADVHYAAAHYYDPAQATFTDFLPFWEFVAGPMHAGTFGPNALDPTFGPQVKFQSVPPGFQGNRSPAEGLQFFGRVQLTAATGELAVSLHNLQGDSLYDVVLPPA